MSRKDLSPEERFQRGKKLLTFGLFSVVVVTVVTVLLITWVVLPTTGAAIQSTLITAAVSIAAAIVVWLIYTRLMAPKA